MSILVTGAAGFIGFHTAKRLIEKGKQVVALDDLNNYYDQRLKYNRIKVLKKIANNNPKKFIFLKINLKNKYLINKTFKKFKFKKVIHLAAQAGVRYSLKNPNKYIDSNIVGFLNILEACRNHKILHLVYASTSSVYGANTKMPYKENKHADHPIQLYAATKRSNELMAHSYSYLFKLPTTGLRFFTVYGPWGRPDMALFLFTKKIIENKKIEVFNFGKHVRDFTYIDDVVDGIIKVLKKPPKSNFKWSSYNPDPSTSVAPFKILNIGNSNPVHLSKYISCIEKELGKKAKKKFLKLQAGDIPKTYADISKIRKIYNYKNKTSIENGIKKFVKWYKSYYHQK